MSSLENKKIVVWIKGLPAEEGEFVKFTDNFLIIDVDGNEKWIGINQIQKIEVRK